jgi:hypothetical protein
VPTAQADPDLIAEHLLKWSRFAKTMPPSWDGAGVSVPVAGSDGAYLGKILPGRGLYLDMDLAQVGINRPMPSVFERSRFRRIEDAVEKAAPSSLRDRDLYPYAVQNMAITTYDGIINSRTAGKANDIAIAKVSVVTTANQWQALNRMAGQPGAMTFLATTAPTDAVTDRATAGAWSTGLYNPATGEDKYLLTFGFTAAQQLNMAILADVLVHGGAFRLTVNTEEIVSVPTAVNRQYNPTLGAGNLVTFIATTANSVTSHTFMIKYTNQGGTAGQTFTTSAITVASLADGLYPVNYGPFVPFAAGDYGIQSLKSTTSSVALAAGVLASQIYFPLSFVPGIAQNAYVERDSTIQVDGLTQLVEAPSSVLGCLTLYVLPNTTSTGVLTAFIRTCSG